MSVTAYPSQPSKERSRRDTRLAAARRLYGRNLAIRGGIAVALGLLALLWHVASLFGFVMVFAAFAAADGLFALGLGLSRVFRSLHPAWPLILRGMTGVAIGTVFILSPAVTVLFSSFAVLMLVIAWALTAGFAEIAAGVELHRSSGQWHLIAGGALFVLLGLLLAAGFIVSPLASIVSVAWMWGTCAVLNGVTLLIAAARLRNLNRG